tara:strand:+ start:9761 stop:10669 length:909 start_codon:yes stop_codon:yes gene_type:complete
MENFDEFFDVIDDICLNSKKEKICCDNDINYIKSNEGIICSICNKLISNISNDPEWKLYHNKNSKDSIRCGAPQNLLLPKSSIGTSVKYNKYNKDMQKVIRYQTWNAMTYKERSRNKIFNNIKDICNHMKLTQIIINESYSLYVIASNIKISRGKNRKGIISACIYYACKNCGVPRSNKEIAIHMDINSVVITKGVKEIQQLFHMNGSTRLNHDYTINYSDFIDRFCNKLNLLNKHALNIKQLALNAEKNKLISDNTPPSIAAGCIYLYCLNNNINISKKNISNVSGISEVTINKCLAKLKL